MASDYKQICLDNIRRRGEEFDDIGRLISEQLYSDKSHFIYELLQNAEDALGRRFKLNPSDRSFRKVRFILFPDRLEFRHFGALFNEEDVKGISDVLKGTKKEDIIQIGKFGIGFKSVYSFTSSPEIHSGDEHFIIRRYIRPEAQLSIPSIEINETVFVFPFNHQEFSKKEAFELIFNKLQGLGPRVLLFLRWIDEIEWFVEPFGEKGQYIKEAVKLENNNDVRQITVIGQINGRVEDEDWLVFERYVKIPDSVNDLNNGIPVEIGFLLESNEKDKNERIIKVKNSPLVVFFPTEKETRFGFLMQGPYKTTPGRDNILTDDIWNKLLVQETAKLLTFTVLPHLKQMGLLTVSLIEALPIRMDDFTDDSMFYPIVAAVREALMNQDLLPADDGTFVSAINAKLARGADLRKLLNQDQLCLLFQSTDAIKWLAGEITPDRTPDLHTYLLNELDVEEVIPDGFARKITHSFLASQTDDWFVGFYRYLTGQEALWRSPRWSGDTGGLLRDKPILRLQDDTLIVPFRSGGTTPNAYLPPLEETNFPIVKRTIVSNEQTGDFLKRLGLSEPNVFDDIVERVLPKYRKLDTSTITQQDYKSDIQKILRALKSDSESGKKKVIEAAKWTPFLKSIDQNDRESFKKPFEIYSDHQVLREYFLCEPNTWFLKIDIEGLNDPSLLHLLGIANTPRIIQTNFKGHSECKLEYSKWQEEYINYEIEGLDSRLASLAALPFDEVKKFSLILWNFVKNYFETDRERFSGQYKWYYYSWKSKKIEASFLSLLKKVAWIPTREHRIAMPLDVTIEQLFDEYVGTNELIDVLGIRQQVVSQTISTEEEKSLEHASELGVNLEDIQFLKSHPEEFEQWKAAMLTQNEKPIFSTSIVANSERRQERFTEQLADASEKEYEKRERSVRTTSGLVDRHPWLKEKYTNEADQMVCQICKKEMPFRKRDGEFYFEAVEALTKDYFPLENEAQYLALCPLCTAMYKEFIKLDDSAMRDLHQALNNSEEPLVPLRLGDKETSIQFVETHWHDMRTILKERS